MRNPLPVSKNINSALDRLVTLIQPSLVMVQSHRNRGGAGVIWHSDGLILTNHHVLGKKKPFVLLEDGRQMEAQVLASDPDIDLALLGIPAVNLAGIQHGDQLPRVGEWVFAFGHPWGQRGSVTSGIVSALISAQTRKRQNLTLLRTDVPLAPGNSGGPLVNAGGMMVGVNNMIIGGDQSVAIPITTIKEFVESNLDSLQDHAWKKAAQEVSA